MWEFSICQGDFYWDVMDKYGESSFNIIILYIVKARIFGYWNNKIETSEYVDFYRLIAKILK